MKFTYLVVCMFLALSATVSCTNTKKIAYFNNIQDTTLTSSSADYEPLIHKSDLLNITISSLNPEASIIFNTPNLIAGISSTNMGSGGASASSSASSPTTLGTPQFTGYLVNSDGNIQFPVLGALSVAGLTKKQLEQKIVTALVEKKLLIDPIVSVRFLNFRVTVLGEVARPTTINVSNEKISILEALGLAGDLTIYGKRENVLLIREEGAQKIIHRINLSSQEILTSPFYFLKTNDIVYVEPNSAKIASTSRTQQLLPIILSALSFVAVIVTYSLKN